MRFVLPTHGGPQLSWRLILSNTWPEILDWEEPDRVLSNRWSGEQEEEHCLHWGFVQDQLLHLCVGEEEVSCLFWGRVQDQLLHYVLGKKKFSAVVGGEIKTSSVTRVRSKYMMTTVKECEEYQRSSWGKSQEWAQEVKEGTPNVRLVINLINRLEAFTGVH